MKVLDTTQEDTWTSTLGLSRFDLFGPGFATDLPGAHSVLLDGTSSFLFSVSDDPALAVDEELNSLAWSSNLRHCVRVIPAINELRLLKTSELNPMLRRYRTPSDARGLNEVFGLIEADRATDRQDVIRVALTAYRMLRQELRDRTDDKQILRAFNSIMALREQMERGAVESAAFETLQDCIDAVAGFKLEYLELPEIEQAAQILVGQLLRGLNDGFGSGRTISTHLLLRHASSELYQEAHLFLQEPKQLRFPGMAGGEAEQGRLRKDIRFTPSALARVLTRETFEFAYRGALDLTKNIRILDPACGSGIFLKEALRELTRRESNAHLTVRGIDVSDLSVVMSRFVVGRAAADARFEVDLVITEADALGLDWECPQIVLMNPPFVQVENLDEEQRASATQVLGDAATGRFDLSMAFISKASTVVADEGVVTSLLPASLLETKSGELWRSNLAAENHIKLLGRFQGFNLFRGSTVEIGLLTFHRSNQNIAGSTMLLVAEATREGAALRAIRLLQEGQSEGFELFTVPQSSVDSASWLPRSLWSLELKKALAGLDLKRISDIFDVKQGIRTGSNSDFVLDDSRLRSLPTEEWPWFRRTVGQGSISGGSISSRDYVFYPFDRNGYPLANEIDLQQRLPFYYEQFLVPRRDALISRARRNDDNWWRLSEHRSWLVESKPKIVSTYFGGSGCFAFDAEGSLAVVQGFGWLKLPTELEPQDMDEDDLVAWERSRAPFAYVALLNSEFFQQVLALYCPRVQGGQFDLSPRYVNNVPIPDLDDDMRVPPDVSESLADLGEMMSRRESVDRSKLEALARVAYGLR